MTWFNDRERIASDRKMRKAIRDESPTDSRSETIAIDIGGSDATSRLASSLRKRSLLSIRRGLSPFIWLFFFAFCFRRIGAQAVAPASPLPLAPPESLAIATPLGCPWGVVADSKGRVLFSDALRRRIYRLDGEGVLTVVAGSGTLGDDEDDGHATQVSLNYPTSLAIGSDDALYVSDAKAHRVWKIAPDGLIRTLAGTGVAGFDGDGGLATAAKLDSPHGLSLDSAGNLYIADTGNRRIRRVRPDGIIETAAGGSKRSSRGDGGPALKARLFDPFDVCVEPNGGWLIADRSDSRIREVSRSGIIETLAGGGDSPAADGGIAKRADLGTPVAIRADRDGSVLFIDSLQKRLYRIRDGKLSLLADPSRPIDGLGASEAGLSSPVGLAALPDGGWILSDWSARRLFSVGTDGSISVLAGDGGDGAYQPGRTGRAVTPIAHPMRGIVAMQDGSLLFADPMRNRILKLEPGIGVSEFPSPNPSDSEGDAMNRRVFYGPAGLAFAPNGDLLFSEARSHRIRRLSPDGRLSGVAGIGAPGFFGDGGPGSKARFWNPSGLCLSPTGILLIADTLNHRVRALSPNGIVTTVAGPKPIARGETKFPDDEPLKEPTAAIFDSEGRIAIADTGNALVRRVSPDGSFRTLAGGGSEKPAPGLSALAVRLAEPVALAQGSDGVLAVADATENVVVGIDPGGVVRFVIGSGEDSGDEDESDPAKVFLNQPSGLTYDASGSLYLATRDRVWKYDAKGELISIGDASLSGWKTYFGRRKADPTLSDRLSDAFARMASDQRSVSLHWIQKPRADLIATTSATISWETEPESWCFVSYGENGQLDHQIALTTFGQRQFVTLSDLQPGHDYQVQVTASRSAFGFRDGLIGLPIALTTEMETEPSPPDSAPDQAPPSKAATASSVASPNGSLADLLRSLLREEANPMSLADIADALRAALGLK